MEKNVLKVEKKFARGKLENISLKSKQHVAQQLEIDISNNLTNIDNDIESKNLEIQEKEKIDEAEQSVSKQKSKKKKIWNAIFFILNVIVVVAILVYQISNETITPFTNIQNTRFYLLPVMIAAFVLIMTCDAYRTNLFLKKSNHRSRPFLCYKMCAIGKYYDFITPMSSGGEPSQIFYMSHRGLNASDAISVPMARYVVGQMSWMIVGIGAVLAIIFTNVIEINLAMIIGLVGFTGNFLLLLVFILLSMSKKIGNKLVIKVLRFLQKIHIVKHYEKQYEKVMNVVESYQSTMKKYAKNKLFFLYTLLISLVISVLTYTLPYIIYLFLGGNDFSIFGNMFVFSVMLELASSIIPIPGGTGLNEISFTVIYADIFPEGTVFWGLLLWRFLTYYIFLLQGISIVIYDYFVGNRKYQWLKRKWELETESTLFREEQIKLYKKQKRKKK